MRAVLCERNGPPEVLRLADLPVPEPGPGQVRVRVRAGGVQPFDVYVRRGDPEFRQPLPHQLGNEFAGVVDRPGPGVSEWAPGDAVLGWAPMTALADFVLADRDAIITKPVTMPFEVAGALSASGQTALAALDRLNVAAGETLLIHAAAGGAGTMAVQIARHRGVRVIGTAGASNQRHLESLGAVPVEYGPGLVDRVRALAPTGVDAALDAIGGQALHDSIELVGDRSRIATLADHALAARLGVHGIRTGRRLERLRVLADLYQRGVLRVTIRARFGIERIADAHRAVEQGHGRGKVVVVMNPGDGEPRPD